MTGLCGIRCNRYETDFGAVRNVMNTIVMRLTDGLPET